MRRYVEGVICHILTAYAQKPPHFYFPSKFWRHCWTRHGISRKGPAIYLGDRKTFPHSFGRIYITPARNRPNPGRQRSHAARPRCLLGGPTIFHRRLFSTRQRKRRCLWWPVAVRVWRIGPGEQRSAAASRPSSPFDRDVVSRSSTAADELVED